MTKAIAPKKIPELPEGRTAWARSTKRAGVMFHAHSAGFTACNSVVLDRHQSETASGLGDMQYWGVCPRCLAKVVK